MENVKNSIKAGGAREGAGRKKELPEGARVTSFKLTETERIAVKNFIAELRGGKKSQAEMLETKSARAYSRNYRPDYRGSIRSHQSVRRSRQRLPRS